ncbi:MAG: hypothetical protein LAN71_15425 [Acidobacteriia bacterium]|nr:hypothetical protein [Terriglobia bacterium]
MSKRFLLLLVLIGLAPVCRGAEAVSVRIRNAGLGGIVSSDGQISWIQADVRNTTRLPLSFDLVTAELALDKGSRPVTETLRLPMTLAPGEARTVDMALHISFDNSAVLLVQALDAAGMRLGAAARRAPAKASDGKLIAMLCATPGLCRDIRQSMLLSGSTEEQSRKSGALRLVQVKEAPPVWWGWTGVETVIVAVPSAQLSAAQREALEIYLLNGGTIVLLEDQLKDGVALEAAAGVRALPTARGNGGFLESYRRRLPPGQLRDVSSGRLIRFASASSQDFADYVRTYGLGGDSPIELRNALRRFRAEDCDCANADRTGWLMKRLGTSFRFPTFLEMLLWMTGYLFLVGVVNFVVLRLAGRPEWSWITIPVIAVIFSCALYLVSARNRPRNFGLDEMTVYQMDSLSPLAVTELKIRVSAPYRSTLHPNLPGQIIPQLTPRYERSADIEPFEAYDHAGEYQIGDRWESALPLRKWSFKDLNFSSYRRFPGTVYRDSAGRLHNDTGVSFEQALIADHEDVFLLGIFPAGAVVDLGRVPRSPYSREAGHTTGYRNPDYPGPGFRTTKQLPDRNLSEADRKKFEAEWETLATQRFSVVEFLRGWYPNGNRVFSHTRAVFFGYSREATAGASLRGLKPDYKARSLTVVTFEEWP